MRARRQVSHVIVPSTIDASELGTPRRSFRATGIAALPRKQES